MMVGKSKTATKAQRERMERIKWIGCVPCLLARMPDSQCDVHHVLAGGIGSDRMGHDFTYGNCPWHHKGDCWNRQTPFVMENLLGPSMAREPRLYREAYGTELELIKMQDFLLEAYEHEPWADLQLPRFLIGQLRQFKDSLLSETDT